METNSRRAVGDAPAGETTEGLTFPPGTRGFQINADEMEPDYHAGDVLFIAPSAEGEYARLDGGKGKIVGKLVGFLRTV